MKLVIKNFIAFFAFGGTRLRYAITPTEFNKWANKRLKKVPAFLLVIVFVSSLLYLLIWYGFFSPNLIDTELDASITSETMWPWRDSIGIIPILYYGLLTLICLYLAIDALLLAKNERRMSELFGPRDGQNIAVQTKRYLAFCVLFLSLVAIVVFSSYSTFCALNKHISGFEAGWISFDKERRVFVFDLYQSARGYTIPALIFGVISCFLVTTKKHQVHLLPSDESSHLLKKPKP